jgi:hypothetical protein
MEHKRLEIILLAYGIVVLVALMSIVLWLGHRKRNQERRGPYETQSYSTHTQGRECLFKEVFANHPDHDPPLNAHGSPSFNAIVRKRSQNLVGAVHRELRDLRRNLKAESVAGGRESLLDDESEVGLLARSSTEVEIAQHHSERPANGRQSGNARRRTSSSVKHRAPTPRKSQEEPPTDRETD